jgi:hypothetical protein
MDGNSEEPKITGQVVATSTFFFAVAQFFFMRPRFVELL